MDKMIEPQTIEGIPLIEGSQVRVGTLIERDALVARAQRLVEVPGILLIVAPHGFGKTSFALLFAEHARRSGKTAAATYRDMAGMSAAEMDGCIETCVESLEARMHPVIVVDDTPILTEEQGKVFARRLKQFRERGFIFIVSTIPSNRGLLSALREMPKVGSQDLLVSPGEYHFWAERFSIAGDADVYGLTQGIPSLIVTLGAMTSRKRAGEALQLAVRSVCRAVLSELRKSRDSLHRLACMIVLLGSGTIGELERGGVRIRPETVKELMQDYPIFGYEQASGAFSCLGTDSGVLDVVKGDIALKRPEYAIKAVRVAMKVGRIDEGVRLAQVTLPNDSLSDVISQFPMGFALAGHAPIVVSSLREMNEKRGGGLDVGMTLALLASAFMMADLRTARAVCADMFRRVGEIEGSVTAEDWDCAQALCEVWGNANGIALPELSPTFSVRAVSGPAHDLRRFVQWYSELMDGGGSSPFKKAFVPHDDGAAMWIPAIMVEMGAGLHRAFKGEEPADAKAVARMESLAVQLADGRLAALSVRARMVASFMRLMAGMPVVDERAFVDAGNLAIRESDLSTQLLCLLGEGWHFLLLGQITNAQFRSQQIMRLSDKRQEFLRSWALLLDRAAQVLKSSLVNLRDEADCVDLSEAPASAAEAWAVALLLSAARREMDLAAWFSLHRAVLLEKGFLPLARLFLHAAGRKADAIRRALPDNARGAYLIRGDEDAEPAPVFEVLSGALDADDLGRVDISLFGGFRAVRNGHVLTEDIWKRKKVGILAARLSLACGSFVSRQSLLDEMWPNSDYRRARNNLYTSISALKLAFCQEKNGPQYIVGQGDGLALNVEFVTSDVMRFEMLARGILLKRVGATTRATVDACLKLEEIYAGPLYVPEMEDPQYFISMRRSYQSRYIDCMMRGIDAAMEEQDMVAASWLVEAALKHEPLREDVMRHAMKVYAAAGRKREVVELYSSRLQYLEQTVHESPEEETRELYETLVGDARRQALIGA